MHESTPIILIVLLVALSATAAHAKQSMQAGEMWEGEPYTLEVRTITRDGRVLFRLNDENSKALRSDETHTFTDGSKIIVREVYPDRPGHVSFYLVTHAK